MYTLFHIVLISIATAIQSYQLPQEFYAKNELMCRQLAKNPYFDPALIVGKTWRVYYTWIVDASKMCIDFKFKPATPMLTSSVRSKMQEVLIEQPPWDSATLVMIRNRHNHVLFEDGHTPGRFLGVVNLHEYDKRNRKTPVPLLHFQYKLLNGGKYLVTVDCKLGAPMLAARVNEPVSRADIAAVASDLGFGDGYEACVKKIRS